MNNKKQIKPFYKFDKVNSLYKIVYGTIEYIVDEENYNLIQNIKENLNLTMKMMIILHT